MKMLNFVKLSDSQIRRIRNDFPGIEWYNGYQNNNIEKFLPLAEIIFGNCSNELLKEAKNLKWIHIASAGIDAYQPFFGTDILITTSKGVHWRPIAEHILMMMLIFARRHSFFQEKQREKVWYRDPDIPRLLSGQRVGFVGFGGIARALIKLLQPFDMDIVAVKRNASDNALSHPENIWDIRYLDDLLGSSDHIVLCLPLTDETKGLISAEHISKIKKGAFVYNVSRGGIIDEQKLMAGLKETMIAGAALDVFEDEPLSPNSLWWDMDNVIITPHIAGHYAGLKVEILKLFRSNLERYLCGKELFNRVNIGQKY